MACNSSVTFNGFTFTYLENDSSPADGIFSYRVESAAPPNAMDLSNWVLEVCPDCRDYFIDHVDVEDATFNPAQGGADWDKRSFVPPNQVPLIGVVFNYSLRKEPNNSFVVTVEFDQPLEVGEVRVGFKAGNNTFVSPTTICGPVCTGIKGACSP